MKDVVIPKEERDRDIVKYVYEHRYLTTEQLTRLIGLQSGQEQNTARCLRRLQQGKFVDSFQVSEYGQPFFYKLHINGARFLAQQKGLSDYKKLKHWSRTTKNPQTNAKKRKSNPFIKHHVALNDFLISLRLFCEDREDVSLKGLIPEYRYKRTAAGGVNSILKHVIPLANGEPLDHTPDAVFCLSGPTRSRLYFLEIDMGTETVDNKELQFFSMLKFYQEYARRQEFNSYTQEFGIDPLPAFLVLIVTSCVVRVENIRKLSYHQEVDENFTKFVRLTTHGRITDPGLQHPILTSMHQGIEKNDKIYR